MKYLPLVLLLTSVASAQTAVCQGRTVTHAMGKTCVPTTPKRVIVLDTGALDTALSVGIKPIAATTLRDDTPFPQYLMKDAEGITSVGGIAEPSLEKILALKPDLILSSKVRHGQIYPQLSKIAPTVFTEEIGVTWQSDAQLWAKALGKEALLNAQMRAYKARAAKLSARFPDRTVSILRFTGPQIRSMNKANFIGTVLQDAGLKRPAFQDTSDFAKMITLESLPNLGSDYLFYTRYKDGSAENLKLFMDSAFWKALPAVKNGRAIEVLDDHWMTGLGVKAANLVLNDLEKHLK